MVERSSSINLLPLSSVCLVRTLAPVMQEKGPATSSQPYSKMSLATELHACNFNIRKPSLISEKSVQSVTYCLVQFQSWFRQPLGHFPFLSHSASAMRLPVPVSDSPPHYAPANGWQTAELRCWSSFSKRASESMNTLCNTMPVVEGDRMTRSNPVSSNDSSPSSASKKR
jgi:hypothetical protein